MNEDQALMEVNRVMMPSASAIMVFEIRRDRLKKEIRSKRLISKSWLMSVALREYNFYNVYLLPEKYNE